MTREPISRAVRRQVRDRAGNRCEYCQHPTAFSCAPFVCEHVVPRVRGAGNTAAELAWARPACNGHKYAKTHAPRSPGRRGTSPVKGGMRVPEGAVLSAAGAIGWCTHLY